MFCYEHLIRPKNTYSYNINIQYPKPKTSLPLALPLALPVILYLEIYLLLKSRNKIDIGLCSNLIQKYYLNLTKYKSKSNKKQLEC